MHQRCQSSRARRGGHRARRGGHAIGEGGYQSRPVTPALLDYRHRCHSYHQQHPSISRRRYTKLPSTQTRDNRSSVAHPKTLLKAMGDAYTARGDIYTATALQKESVCIENPIIAGVFFCTGRCQRPGFFAPAKHACTPVSEAKIQEPVCDSCNQADAYKSIECKINQSMFTHMYQTLQGSSHQSELSPHLRQPRLQIQKSHPRTHSLASLP